MGILQSINKVLIKDKASLGFYKVGDVLSLLYENKGGFWKVRKFTGICIAITGKGINERITLRNIINSVPVEFSFYSNSNSVIELRKLPIVKLKRLKKSKLYYLRNKRTNLSKVTIN